MSWEIEYYFSINNKCSVKEFIESLSPEGQAKYIFITRLMKEYGINVKEPYVKQITGRKKLFEIRIKDKSSINRILYFSHTGKKFVLLHGFTKKRIRLRKGRLK